MGYETSTKKTFYAVMIGYLANTAFPRLGEVTRCGVLSKETKVPFNALFGTVISERIFDLIVLVMIIFGVILFQLDFLSGFVDKYFVNSITGMINMQSLIVLIAGFILVIVLPFILYKIFTDRIKSLTIFKKLSEFGKGLLEGVKTIKRMKHKWAFLLWTLIIWVLYSLMTYVAFFALDATTGLDFWDGVTIMALGSLGIVAPVPAGIGAYQFIVKAILYEIYLVPSEPAASFSIIMWATQIVLIIVVGFLSYYLVFMHKSKKNENTN
jgi:uncharacterized protein (TIRG00374 family)